MFNRFHGTLIDLTGIILFGLAVYLLSFSDWIQSLIKLPSSVYTMSTIFLSILIEALPFVLIGVMIAGSIQIFITEDHIRKWMPKNKFSAVIMSCVLGACFPGCECGIVPITRKLLQKGVPIYAAIGFMLTGPLINPIVIASTYMAFGNSWMMAISRMLLGFFLAVIIASVVSLLFHTNQLKEVIPDKILVSKEIPTGFGKKFVNALKHGVDEFFDMGKYLIIGCLFAAFVQTYVSSEKLMELGEGTASASLVMMGLAYLLSLCSEADAFVAASFQHAFPPIPILSFLIYGPMIDLKNTLMMFSIFHKKFVFIFLLIVTVIVFGGLILVQGFY